MIKEYSIPSNTDDEIYSVTLSFIGDLIDIPKTTCTCKFGSCYRYSKKNQELNNWQCQHIQEALKKHHNNEIDNLELAREEAKKIQIKPFDSPFQ